jgi:Glycosyltransferase 61
MVAIKWFGQCADRVAWSDAMLKRSLPLANLVRYKLHLLGEMSAAAVDQVVVQAAETQDCDPPVFLAGQLEKITAATPFTPLEAEIAVARSRTFHHAAVVKYSFSNCLVHDAGFDTAGFRFKKKHHEWRHAFQKIKDVPRALYCASAVSHTFFGHWLQDQCTSALFQETHQALLLDVRADWPHAGDYVERLALRPKPPGAYYVAELSYYSDHGQGSDKRRRYAEVRRRLAASIPDAGAGHEKVYFRRGDMGADRQLSNDEAIAKTLVKCGFHVFELKGATVASILATFSNAKLVVSVDGSHLNHLYFAMPPGSALISLIPADRFTMTQAGYAAAVGLKYGFVVIDPGSTGYQVNLADLQATMDLIQRPRPIKG